MKRILIACLLMIPFWGAVAGPEQIERGVTSLCLYHPKKDSCILLANSLIVLVKNRDDAFMLCNSLKAAGSDQSKTAECQDAAATRIYIDKLEEQLRKHM
ncbi:hypothetical protein [Budvicia aquatica]|uniref:Uncharacterized protein n=1 Tax=Budvicia aquatica TaxID=82979 RepID=A0A2C6DQ41_9GAMM|nr:hypothetical protein [Budvicia aquatica]PHI30803.1 hypothetical protein CRN84_16385 [Budvicia aquatica]VFS50535.1 Uncharacterised protein [Budvicia aquatica]